MAGTLTVDTLKASTGTLATQNGMTGICKAWVSYNGQGQTIRNSFNVSSVIYNSGGNYTVNFTTAIASADPATVLGAGGMDTGVVVTFPTLGSYNSSTNYATTTSVKVYVSGSNTGIPGTNAYYYCVAVFA